MSNEIIQLFTNNVGSVVTAGAFIFYLLRRDREFSRVISNHLDHANQTQKETNDANRLLAKELQHLSDTIYNLDKKVKGKKKIT